MDLQIVKEFANGEEKPSEKENIEDYRDGEFTSHRGICGSGGLFFCPLTDPDLSAPSYDGAVYACDDE